jgi:hypothetical protein
MASTVIVLGAVLGLAFLLYGYMLGKDHDDSSKVKTLSWVSYVLGVGAVVATGWYVFHHKKKTSLEDLTAAATPAVVDTSGGADADVSA